MASRYVHRDIVQFSDTDMAGIMHFANFFRFMERAEHAFFRSLGYSIMERREKVPADQRVGWPRVHASCDYLSPLRFEDEVDVEVLIDEIRTRSLKYIFRVRKADGTLAAEGKIAVVCVRKDPETREMKAVAIPQHILEKIEVAPEDIRKSLRTQITS